MAEEVKLYGTWVSPFSRRIELALKMKGVPFEYIEVDLSNKSPEILKYNPVHKKIPVLVHNGKSIVESLIILEYIEDTWKNNPILPQDLHQRADAGFWAKFVDEKLLATGIKASLAEGKEKELLNEEVLEQMKLLESELNGKDFFGGEAIALVDIVATVVAFWFPESHEVLGVEVLTQEKFPALLEWIGKLQAIDVVNQSRPPREKHLAHILSSSNMSLRRFRKLSNIKRITLSSRLI